MEHLGCHAFFNFLVDQQAGRLRLNACAGIPVEAARQIEWLDFGAAVCGCAARDGCRIVAEHIQTTPDPRTDLVRSYGIQAYACHPLMNQGQVIGTLSFGSRDKTAFGEDELELMKTVADHVAIAMQRVRMLESLRSRHAQAAQAANEAKSQFLADMSHELRTPMNAILGMIDVALPKANDPTIQDCLQTAKGSADLLLTLLNDLLDSAKIESGKLPLESAPFSLRRVLDQIPRVLAVRASEKGLCFSCRMPDAVPDAVVGDRMRLQQVLLNLGSNAIKFTERGDVTIDLRVAEQSGLGSSVFGPESSKPPSPPQCPRPKAEDLRPAPPLSLASVTLEFIVRDTGIGIASSYRERLFLPFAQADASMTRRFGGTGLGLTICKSLVEAMDGRIWVESEVGKGSQFYFTVRLPLADKLPPEFDAPAAVPEAPSPLAHPPGRRQPGKPKTGYLHLARSGPSGGNRRRRTRAISLSATNRYHVILMDVQMPGVDGLEAAAAIRKREAENGHGNGDTEKEDSPHLPQRPEGCCAQMGTVPLSGGRVPIIAMTAHAMKGDREHAWPPE